ncbi:hypothetical protein [Spartinivicinus ruber]|uniref:hypothetical protein n=1 Tax=Spartinivicinus ruber TaxID=2683272 RepID=UPI0013D5F1A8|nr:hypothetical protein [Spartinivicinus ruber]
MKKIIEKNILNTFSWVGVCLITFISVNAWSKGEFVKRHQSLNDLRLFFLAEADVDSESVLDVTEDAISDEIKEDEEGILLDVDSDEGEIDLESLEELAEGESTDRYGITYGLSTTATGSWLSRSDSNVSHYEYAQLNGFLQYQPSEAWEWHLGVRADYDKQVGSPDFEAFKLDYDEIYLRHRTDQFSFTIGSQIVLWGVADEVAPTDQVSVQDLTRGLIPDWENRHRAYPMLRFEYFMDSRKLDAIWLPDFRAAELPNDDSIWAPIKRDTGQVFAPLRSFQVSQITIGEDDDGSGGGGLRYSVTAEGFDYSIALLRVKRSLPYYKLSNETLNILRTNPNPLAILTASDDNLIETHPYSWVVGGDITFQAWDVTWRLEGAFSSEKPATKQTLDYTTYDGFDWVFSGEFYPGDGDDRLNLQLVGSTINANDKLVDRKRVYSLNGQYEGLYSNERWRLRVRFNHGLNLHDDFIATEFAFLGWEPHEFYLASYFFDGSPRSVGGFFKNNNMFTIGWRGEF